MMKKLKFGEDLTNAINELIDLKINQNISSVIRVVYSDRNNMDVVAWNKYITPLNLKTMNKGNAFDFQNSKIICKKDVTARCSFNISYLINSNVLQTGAEICLKRNGQVHTIEFYNHGLQNFIHNLNGEVFLELKTGDELYLQHYIGDSKKLTIYGDGSKTYLTIIEI
jgi:C1q domain